MTEKDIYKNGVAVLEEWEDVNYCEHSFKFKDEWLTDKEVVDLLNDLNEENDQLKKENQELRQDNDIKFWKFQCIQSSNNNQIMLFELGRAIQQGYEVSDKFKQYLGEIKEHGKEIQEKHKRLFEYEEKEVAK